MLKKRTSILIKICSTPKIMNTSSPNFPTLFWTQLRKYTSFFLTQNVSRCAINVRVFGTQYIPLRCIFYGTISTLEIVSNNARHKSYEDSQSYAKSLIAVHAHEPNNAQFLSCVAFSTSRFLFIIGDVVNRKRREFWRADAIRKAEQRKGISINM